jgi:hypothetical protein
MNFELWIPLWTGFVLRPVLVGFMVDKGALGFIVPSASLHQCSVVIFFIIFKSTLKRANGRSLGTLQKT